MSIKQILLVASAILILPGCRPKPIDIEIPQKPGTLAISSACLNAGTVYVSAGYSVSTLKKLLDTSAVKELSNIPKEMLVDSGIVTIRAYGQAPDTLKKISAGLYGRQDLHLIPGVQYSLLVRDYKKNVSATAVTTYLPQPEIDSMYPQRLPGRTSNDVKLQLRLRNLRAGMRFCVSYNTAQHMRESATPLPFNMGALYSFVPKQLELITVEAAGSLDKAITLQVSPGDTVFVQVGQIDRAYYDYLAAYKRTGALINQLTGEPINLPTNIVTGLGFFSLYHPVRAVYDLNKF